jgi:hypothetical protein
MSAAALAQKTGRRLTTPFNGLAPCPAGPARPSAALIETLYRKASLLHHALYGLYAKANDDNEPEFADEDLFPLWEVSTAILVGLCELHEAAP